MNTPTPRTDAKQKLKDIIGDEYVAVDFARQLERELTAARKELKAVTEQRDKLAELSGFGEFDKPTEP